jgi:hypothetical protein
MGDEGGLVVLPMERLVQVLNPVGIKVYSMLDGSHSESQIAEAVAAEFEVDLEQAASDVSAFLEELRENGMLADGEDVETAAKESR